MRRFDDVFNRFWRNAGFTDSGDTPESWSIPLDITRNDDEVTVKASLPGVSKDKVDVTIEENVLTIRAELDEDDEREDAGYLLRERRTGSFLRSVRLPEIVDSEKANSSYADGVLIVHLPKLEEKKARKIAVAAD